MTLRDYAADALLRDGTPSTCAPSGPTTRSGCSTHFRRLGPESVRSASSA